MTSLAPAALASGRRLPNRWDIAALAIVVGALVGVAEVARGTFAPLAAVQVSAISLDPSHLPEYAVRTIMRMFAALFASLAFTLTVATLAARSKRAATIIVPMLDILQSVPILGFLSFTVTFFLALFPGRVLGAELAAIFVIFTSQAWNMAFSFYQSLTTEPADLIEASRCFRLLPWQRFWRLDVPFAVPGLVWNTMLSMSGGWFFVVASEAVSVGNTTFTLPGIGSYVAAALDKRDLGAVFWAVFTMLIVILLYDQLLFRPLVAWSAKFRFETTQSAQGPEPWVLALLRRTAVLRAGGEALSGAMRRFGGLRLSLPLPAPRPPAADAAPSRLGDGVFYTAVALVALYAVWRIAAYAVAYLSFGDVGTALLLGIYTMLRVLACVALSCVIWVPIGVAIGFRPRAARIAQPVAQFLAAFPANLLFPPIVVAIVAFHLAPNVWLTPLMMLGTQWYILFNVIAGAAALPNDLKEAATNLGLSGALLWRRLIIPGILPYFVTGGLTASGAAWNASIVAEVASWGNTHLAAAGLGAYIAQATADGHTARVVLGVVVMAAFVLTFNRTVWRPLFAYASRRTTLS